MPFGESVVHMKFQARDERQILRKEDKLVTINVSGRRFSTWESTLKRYPNTLLGSEALKDFLDKEKKEYFLDRDPHMFRYILNFYRVGKLHFSVDDCLAAFHDELSFYGICGSTISDCCWEECLNSNKKNNEAIKPNRGSPEQGHGQLCNRFCCKQAHRDRTFKLKECIWDLLENTNTHRAGRCVQSFIGILIYVSVLTTIIETIECANDKTCEEMYPDIFFGIDAFCMGFFTLEYLLRFYAASKKITFILNRFNVIDLLVISPFYVHLALRFLWSNTSVPTDNASALVVLRILRVFRIFKLSRHSRHMRQIGSGLKKAFTDLGFLFFAFGLANILFASVLYFLEKDTAGSKFKSIPDAMWYCIITMMTVG